MSNKLNLPNHPDPLADKKAKGISGTGLQVEELQNKNQLQTQPSAMDTGPANLSRPNSSMADFIGEPRSSNLRIRTVSYSNDGKRSGGVSSHFTSNDTVCILNGHTGQSVVVASNQSTRDALASLCQRESEIERQEAAAAQMELQNSNLQAMNDTESNTTFETGGSVGKTWEEARAMTVPRARSQSVQFVPTRKRNIKHRVAVANVQELTEQEIHMLSVSMERTPVTPNDIRHSFPNDEHMAQPGYKMQSAVNHWPTVPAPMAVNGNNLPHITASNTTNPMMPLDQLYTGPTIAECLSAIGGDSPTKLGKHNSPRKDPHFGTSRFLENQPAEVTLRTMNTATKRSRNSIPVKNSRNADLLSNTMDRQWISDEIAQMEYQPIAYHGPPGTRPSHQPHKTVEKFDFRSQFAELTIPASVREGIQRVNKKRKNGGPNRLLTDLLSNRSQSAPGRKTDKELIAFLKVPLALAKAAELEAIKRRMMESPPKRKSRAKSSMAAATSSFSSIVGETVQRRTAGHDKGHTKTNSFDCSHSKSTPISSEIEIRPFAPGIDAAKSINQKPELTYTTKSITGIEEQSARKMIRSDMPFGQALQEVPLGAVAGQLRVQREMHEKKDTHAVLISAQELQQDPNILQQQHALQASPKMQNQFQQELTQEQQLSNTNKQNPQILEQVQMLPVPSNVQLEMQLQSQEVDNYFREPAPPKSRKSRAKQKTETSPPEIALGDALFTEKQQQKPKRRAPSKKNLAAEQKELSIGIAACSNRLMRDSSRNSVQSDHLQYENSLPVLNYEEADYGQQATNYNYQNYSVPQYKRPMALPSVENLLPPIRNNTQQDSFLPATNRDSHLFPSNGMMYQQDTHSSRSQSTSSTLSSYALYSSNPSMDFSPNDTNSQSAYNANTSTYSDCSISETFGNSPMDNHYSTGVNGNEVYNNGTSQQEQEHQQALRTLDSKQFLDKEWTSMHYLKKSFLASYDEQYDKSEKIPGHQFMYLNGLESEPVITSVRLSDDSIQYTDGSILRTDKTILRANGIIIDLDGHVIPPISSSYDYFGQLMLSSGHYVFNYGYIMNHDGTFIRPDGSLFAPTGPFMDLGQIIDMLKTDPIDLNYILPEAVSPASEFAASTTTSSSTPISSNVGLLNNTPVIDYNSSNFLQNNGHFDSVPPHSFETTNQSPNTAFPVLENSPANGSSEIYDYTSDTNNSQQTRSPNVDQTWQSPATDHQIPLATDQSITNTNVVIADPSQSKATEFNHAQPLDTPAEQPVRSSSKNTSSNNNFYCSSERLDETPPQKRIRHDHTMGRIHQILEEYKKLDQSENQTNVKTSSKSKSPIKGQAKETAVNKQATMNDDFVSELELTRNAEKTAPGNKQSTPKGTTDTVDITINAVLARVMTSKANEQGDEFQRKEQIRKKQEKQQRVQDRRKDSQNNQQLSDEKIKQIFEQQKREQELHEKQQQLLREQQDMPKLQPMQPHPTRDKIILQIRPAQSKKRKLPGTQHSQPQSMIHSAILVCQPAENTFQIRAPERQRIIQERQPQKQKQQFRVQSVQSVQLRENTTIYKGTPGQQKGLQITVQKPQKQVMLNWNQPQQHPEIQKHQEQELEALTGEAEQPINQNKEVNPRIQQSSQQSIGYEQQQETIVAQHFNVVYENNQSSDYAYNQQYNEQQGNMQSMVYEESLGKEALEVSNERIQTKQTVEDLTVQGSQVPQFQDNSFVSNNSVPHQPQIMAPQEQQEVTGTLTQHNSHSASNTQNVKIQKLKTVPAAAENAISPQSNQLSPKEGYDGYVKQKLEETKQEVERAEAVAAAKPVQKVSALVRVKHMRETIDSIAALGPHTLEELWPELPSNTDIVEACVKYYEHQEEVLALITEEPCAPEIGLEDVLDNPELEPSLHGRFRKRLAAIREGRTTQTHFVKKKKKQNSSTADPSEKESAKKQRSATKQASTNLSSRQLTPLNEDTLSQAPSEDSQQLPLSVTTNSNSFGPSPATSGAISPSFWATSQQQESQDVLSGKSSGDEESLATTLSTISNSPLVSEEQTSPPVAPVVERIVYCEEDNLNELIDGLPFVKEDVMLSDAACVNDPEDGLFEEQSYEEVGPEEVELGNSDGPMDIYSMQSLIELDFSPVQDPPTPNNGVTDDYSSDFASFDLLHSSPMRLGSPLRNDTVACPLDMIDFSSSCIAPSKPISLTQEQDTLLVMENAIATTAPLTAIVNEAPNIPDFSDMPDITSSAENLVMHRVGPKSKATKPASRTTGRAIVANPVASDSFKHNKSTRSFPQRPYRSSKPPRTNFKEKAKKQDLTVSVVGQLQYKTTRNRGNEFLSPVEQNVSGFHLMDQLQGNNFVRESFAASEPATIRELVKKHVVSNVEPTLQNQKPYAHVIEKMTQETAYLFTKGEFEKKLLPEEIIEPAHQGVPLRRGFIHWPGSAGYGELTLFDRNAIRDISQSASEASSVVDINDFLFLEPSQQSKSD